MLCPPPVLVLRVPECIGANATPCVLAVRLPKVPACIGAKVVARPRPLVTTTVLPLGLIAPRLRRGLDAHCGSRLAQDSFPEGVRPPSSDRKPGPSLRCP